MDLPEGKQALEEIQALERRLDARIKETKAKAKEIESSAAARAAELVAEQENAMAALRQPPRVFPAPPEEPGGAVPDERLVKELAGELFERIKRT